MPFEPLRTDEKLEKPSKPRPDMDAVMLFGCSGFVLTSVGGYILSVWPFLVLPDADRLRSLALCAAIGLVPAAILGIFAIRKFALAGACGFIGGAMATGIFLYLRIEQTFISAIARQAPKPDYPQILTYLVPAGWIVTTILLSLLLMPPEKED